LAVAVDYDRIARDAVREIGDTDATREFHADGVNQSWLSSSTSTGSTWTNACVE
jgi:hypothetical protein